MTSTDPPDSITIGQFMRDERYGRYPMRKSRNPFTCGITGRTYSAAESHERSDMIAKAVGKRLHWSPREGTPWDKVAGVFSFNSVSDNPIAEGS